MIRHARLLLIPLMLFGLVSMVWIGSSRASNQTITCDQSGCDGVAGSLFSESNLYPTQSIVRSVTAENDYPEPRYFAIEIAALNFSDSTPSLSEMLSLTIRDRNTSTIVYGPTSLWAFKNQGFTLLNQIPSGQSTIYDFEVTLADVGNQYQGKQLSFDLNLGFDALETPPPSLRSSSLSVTAVSCENQNFDAKLLLNLNGTPQAGVSVEFEYDGTKLTRITDSNGFAQGGFSLDGTQSVYARPQEGYPSQSQVVVPPVECGGGTGGGQALGISNSPTPRPFAARVVRTLGLTDITNETPSPTPQPSKDITESNLSGSVAGACETQFPWWLPLVGQVVLGFLYLLIRHGENNSFTKIVPFLFPLLGAALSLLLHQWIGCPCESSYCRYYAYLTIGILIIQAFPALKKKS